MSYNLTLTNGTPLITLNSGINTSKTSINLIGPSTPSYGQALNENFIKTLENFANGTPPPNALTGQLWFDSSTGNVVLKNYNGTTWKALASSSSSSAAPANPQTGDYWWNSATGILSVYNSGTWIQIGPTTPPGTAVTAFVPNTTLDSISSPHVVGNLMVNNKLTGIISSENTTFVPKIAISGIPVVYPGLNLINGLSVTGNGVFGGNLSLSGNGVFGGNLSLSGNGVFGGNLSLSGNGVFGGNLSLSGNVVPSANLTYNLGSPTTWWNNIYGTAVHAQYADLAERFAADAEYESGTVVEMGGPNEITAAVADLSEDVFGVISTKAAYLMNSAAGTDSTHPPIAVQGRVPVRVTGIINKGDRLVSAGNGVARAGQRSEITAWNVIGRALENKTTTGEGVIEAVVKLNS